MKTVRAIVLCLIGALVLTAPASLAGPWSLDWLDAAPQDTERWDRGEMGPQQTLRATRQDTVVAGQIPPVYRGVENPFDPTVQVLLAGKQIYARDCAGCHGQRGFGDGDAGYALDPSPALLVVLNDTPTAADEYLIWALSDGGEPFGSDMPAFRDRLSRDEMWHVIAYMRAGFPTEID
ncbi:MAG: cytochrome c [Pseudomonadota bacterium]